MIWQKQQRFFVPAFNDVEGGVNKKLIPSELEELSMVYICEFKRKYGDQNGCNKKSTLLLCKNEKDEVMGCLGVEVTTFESVDGYLQTPMMENLAVGKKFRRKGVGSQLVRASDDIIHYLWG
jgi:ribosomal protein S18 acetylase RimI-like enzyme